MKIGIFNFYYNKKRKELMKKIMNKEEDMYSIYYMDKTYQSDKEFFEYFSVRCDPMFIALILKPSIELCAYAIQRDYNVYYLINPHYIAEVINRFSYKYTDRVLSELIYYVCKFDCSSLLIDEIKESDLYIKLKLKGKISE